MAEHASLHRIFISYSQRDKRTVRDIADHLDRQFVVLWDWDFVGGENFSSSIFRFIDRIDAFVVVLSKNSVESEWVAKEIAAARQKGLPLVPVRIDDAPIPEALSHLHVVTLQVQRTVAQADVAKLCRDITLQLMSYRRENPESTNPDFEEYAKRSLGSRSTRAVLRRELSWPVKVLFSLFLWIGDIAKSLIGLLVGLCVLGAIVMIGFIGFDYLFTDIHSSDSRIQARLSEKICPSSQRLARLYSEWIDETNEIVERPVSSLTETVIQRKIYQGLLLNVFDAGCFEQEVLS